MTQKLISMSKKEYQGIILLTICWKVKLTAQTPLNRLGCLIRHIKRLKSRVDKYGEDGLIHKSRGRTSNRKLDSVIVKKAKKHLKEKYYDFGPTLAAEKLDKADNIKLGKETVRGIMIKLGYGNQNKENNQKNGMSGGLEKTILEKWNNLTVHIMFGSETKKIVYYCLLMTLRGKSLMPKARSENCATKPRLIWMFILSSCFLLVDFCP